jgi:Insertion element 4 transposase N-terminal
MQLTEERISDRLAIGIMAWAFPPDMIERAVSKSRRPGGRNRLLNPQIMVYFVLTMCLFPNLGYEAVARRLVDGLAMSASAGRLGLRSIPSTAAVSRARMRLGIAPLKALFAEVSGRPPAGSPVPGARHGRWRLWTIDGRHTPVPDSSEGRVGRGPAALRLTVLAEGGTGRLAGADITPAAHPVREGTGDLLAGLGPGDLLMAEGEYAQPDLWRLAAATGTDLLWNIPDSKLPLPVGDLLPDGSRVCRLPAGPRGGAAPDPCTVRVVEESADGTRRLVTTILNPAAATPSELRGVFHRRWDFVQAVRQMEEFRRGRHKTMRSRSPEMVEQELWGHLLIYSTIRSLSGKSIG